MSLRNYFLDPVVNLVSINIVVIMIITVIPASCGMVLTSHDEKRTTAAAAVVQNISNNSYYRSKFNNDINNIEAAVVESLEFLVAHNIVRAKKLLPPLWWDYQLQSYARWWAQQRKGDCSLEHSFPEGGFKLGENVFWGSGSTWRPADAVRDWSDEEKYYDYKSNSCEDGQVCGHYTQIVWRDARRLGCARVVCDDGDVFMTCNYYPPGNYIGERPY